MPDERDQEFLSTPAKADASAGVSHGPTPSSESNPTPKPNMKPRLHIVLIEPEIPNNTGNIGRTCVTTGCKLHLVKPLGFDIDEKACRRAGLDYWPRLHLEEHESAQAYLEKHPPNQGPGRTWFLSTKASQTIYEAPIGVGDHLVFGRESAGLDESIHRAYPDQRICVPMVPGERSLNLSTCVAIVIYEVVRKMIGSGDAVVDDHGRLLTPENQ
ncbi:MAG: tRNA (cytidine(34)-2'-O)-methyltransferase [Phycisphaerales bacterium]